MRTAVFVLAGLQLAILIYFAIAGSPSDAAGNAMSQGYITLAGIVMGIFMTPALILAINRKALGVALALSIVSMTVVVVGLVSL